MFDLIMTTEGSVLREGFRAIKIKHHALFRFGEGYFYIKHLKYFQVKKKKAFIFILLSKLFKQYLF